MKDKPTPPEHDTPTEFLPPHRSQSVNAMFLEAFAFAMAGTSLLAYITYLIT